MLLHIKNIKLHIPYFLDKLKKFQGKVRGQFRFVTSHYNGHAPPGKIPDRKLRKD